MAPRVRAVTAGDGSASFDGAPASQAAASVRGLTRRFGGRVVLDDLDLDIGRGEFVAMIGRSGSGKSTLLRALAGLDRDVTGSLGVAGPVAVAFQEPRLVPWQRVLANVALGLRVPEPARAAAAALDEVGLTERAAAWPLTLSGGEAQRASLARALVRSPSLLLLDEPFSALDALTRITMHRLVLTLWRAAPARRAARHARRGRGAGARGPGAGAPRRADRALLGDLGTAPAGPGSPVADRPAAAAADRTRRARRGDGLTPADRFP